MTDLGVLKSRDSKIWKRDADDWYVEPSWCSERLFEYESFKGWTWDPACGMGRIVLAGRKNSLNMVASDIVQRDVAFQVDFFMDFLSKNWHVAVPVDNIVCNPPFKLARKFVELALQATADKVAMLLPADWILGDKRSRWLETTPLKSVLFLTPRPSMPPGLVILAGESPGNGTEDFAWYVFQKSHSGSPTVGWIRRDVREM